MAKIPFPINEDNQLPGNRGKGISIEAIVKIEKKGIINDPFMLFPPYSMPFRRIIKNKLCYLGV